MSQRSLLEERVPEVAVLGELPANVTAIGVPVSGSNSALVRGLSAERLKAAGFSGALGSTLVVPGAEGPVVVAIGLGESASPSMGDLREAGAAFARAVSSHRNVAIVGSGAGHLTKGHVQGLVEGVALGGYTYPRISAGKPETSLLSLSLVDLGDLETVRSGAQRGRVMAQAQCLARDLANTPHSHLNASLFADLATSLGQRKGFNVEVFGKEELEELGCGGLLGVNAGSVQPPRMIKLRYQPTGMPKGKLALLGKGIMYDSGGISLKPSDPVHAQMKNDMSGAAVVLAAIAALAELGASVSVTGYLMCTDNMPSGTAMALGDVLTMRGGRTVEVMDTDAEGRLVLADALVLATEEPHDAIIDIATLTGSCMRALGSEIAGLFGNDQKLTSQIQAAARETGELVWELPLHRPYLRMLSSTVADTVNCAPVGKPDAILAALFLEGFVGDSRWAHLDICGPAQSDQDRSWHRPGCSGFGARLLAEFADRFCG